MAPETTETWDEAVARKEAQRATLEAEQHNVGQVVGVAAARKRELDLAITEDVRRGRDVTEQRAELAKVELTLADGRSRLAGLKSELSGIDLDAVDGLHALAELHRPELMEKARHRSEHAADLLRQAAVTFRAFEGEFSAARGAYSDAFQIGPGRPGHRAELLDARMPGSDVFSTAALTPQSVRGVGRAPAGAVWVRPLDVLAEMFAALAGYDCLPAAVVRGEQRGEGFYRDVRDGHGELFDTLKLEQRWQDVAGEDGLAPYRLERAGLTDSDRYSLEVARAESADLGTAPREFLPSRSVAEIKAATHKPAATSDPPAPPDLIRADNLNSPPLDGWLDSAQPDAPPDGWISEKRSV